MPLVALLDGKSFDAEHLEPSDRGKEFVCPACHVPFRVVLPKQDIIKHFRHVTKQEHWEPETPARLQMKRVVAAEARACGWRAEIEHKVGDDEWALVDVFLHRTPPVAVECQCSPVTFDEFMRRDWFYRDRGIAPLWILGGKFYDRTQKYTTRKRKGRKPYRIQKIRALEKELLREKRLYHYGGFFRGDFKFRIKYTKMFFKFRILETWTETLGWFKLTSANFGSLVRGLELE